MNWGIFIEQIKEILHDTLKSDDIKNVSVKVDQPAKIAYNYTIECTYKSDRGYYIRDSWDVSCTGMTQCIELLPLIINAKTLYSKKQANALRTRFGSNEQALNSAINSRSFESLYSIEYHKWDFIVKDIMKFG